MDIIPLAGDSLGTRSVATLIKIKGLRVLIDPGVSLGPKRYGLPPHELELKAYHNQWSKVVSEAKKADVLIISHYHYDHYNPFEHLEIYKNKTVFVKNPARDVNQSQKKRAKEFLELIEGMPKKLEYADGSDFKIKGADLSFSPAVFHGPLNTKLGYVMMTSIKSGKSCFVHASDSQGPSVKKTTDWILDQKPEVVWLDGVATLFLGWMEDPKILDLANKEEIRLLESKNIKKIILDHHIVRDLNYKKKIEPVINKARELKKELLTSAEFLGRKPEFLEALRKQLWKGKPCMKQKLPRIME